MYTKSAYVNELWLGIYAEGHMCASLYENNVLVLTNDSLYIHYIESEFLQNSSTHMITVIYIFTLVKYKSCRSCAKL